MCGIIGLVSSAESLNVGAFEDALRILRPRGPDDEGLMAFNGATGVALPLAGRDTNPSLGYKAAAGIQGEGFDVLLGNRRLAIIDLSVGGHQPMSYGERYWITFNGEIYNYIELRAELQAKGYSIRSDSDTEVLLAAYACWGEEMLQRLVGMFALAILDTQEKKLFLARDCFGIKPLFYSDAGGQFAFSSEIKSLLELPNVSRKANSPRLADYLILGYCDHRAETFFGDIRQLEAAHCMTVDLKTRTASTPRKYWALDMEARSTLSFEQAADELRERFMESVALHMRSDSRVGACLSGGIDSSAIVMAMRKIAGPSLEIHTFTYASDDERINELKWAEIVAEAAGAIPHVVSPTGTDLVNDFRDFVSLQDEPFVSTSIYAQYRVYKLAQQSGIKVMLDGQGADELMGGYMDFLCARIASAACHGQFGDFWQLATAGTKDRAKIRNSLLLKSLFLMFPLSTRRALRRIQTTPGSWVDRQWLAKNLSSSEPMPTFGGKNGFREIRRSSVEDVGLTSLLRYQDRNSMAASIESRVPYLTPTFANFLMSLPDSYHIDRSGTTKCVFRHAMRGLVPEAILERRDKIGFSTPERQWLTAMKSWVGQALTQADPRTAPFLVPSIAGQEFSKLTLGTDEDRSTVWRWLNALSWSELLNVDF